MTSYCFIAAQFLRGPVESGTQVTPAFFRSAKPSKRESGLVAAVPSTSVPSWPKFAGRGVVYGCHPAPIRPTQRPTGQTGLESWGDSMTEKNNSSLLQHRKARQVAESMTGQRPVSFSALRPLAAKWVRPELRPAYSRTRCLPHPWVGKTCFPGHAGNGVTGALRTAGATLWGYPAPFSSLGKSPKRAEFVRSR